MLFRSGELEHGESLLEHMEQYQVHINKKTMTQQGLSLTGELLFLLEHGKTYGHGINYQMEEK